jgi:hypothetical protein
MLCLYDDQARQPTEVRPSRGRELRLRVRRAPTGQARAGSQRELGDLRSFWLADLIRRLTELHRLAVTVSADTEPDDGAFAAACSALNIHPADQGEPAGPADLRVGPDQGPAGRSVSAGPVTFLDSALVVWPCDLAQRGLDPLALRLAFLRRPYAEPLDLTWGGLAQTDADLRDWRGRVADWATQPSKPLGDLGEIVAWFDDDLDTPAALAALDKLGADPQTPAGSKFETLAYLDQVLGLDLASEVGRPR